MDGGTVTITFKGDDKDLEKTTEKAKSGLGSLKSVAGTVGKAIAVGIGAGTVAIGGLVKASIDAYAEFEQLEGGLVSLFGENSKEMQSIIATSQTAYKDLTMSQNDYLNSFERTYSIMKSDMQENADAIQYTNKMIQISSDLYNTYGGSVEQYTSAINWALKDTFSYLDNLNIGIVGTDEGFIKAANSSGLFAKTIKDKTELTNDMIIDVIEHYTKLPGALGRTSLEAGTTIIGSMNMVKASWNDLISEFAKGGDLSKPIDNLINSAMTFTTNIMPILNNALNSILLALPSLVQRIGQALPTMLQTLAPTLITTAVQLVQEIVNATPQIITVLAEMLPVLIPALINGLITIINTLAEQMPVLMPIIVDAILQIIPILIDNIPLFISAGAQLLGGLIAGIISAIPILLARVGEIVVKIFSVFKSLDLKQIGADLLKGLWNGVKSMKDWVVDKVKGIGSSILGGLKGILGIHSPSTEFAIVGKYSVLGYTEALDDMKSNVQNTIDDVFGIDPTMYNNASTHFSPNMNMTVVNNMDFDPIGQVVNKVKTYSGGSKNDYSYGQGVS
jgi:phage-related protein